MTSDAQRILLAGATGYVGSAVAAELVSRGYEVTAVTRRPADIGGCRTVVLEDPGNAEAALSRFNGERFDAVISCMASRTGVPDDAWRVDYEANRVMLRLAERLQAARFVLLSAICVQRPRLEFQRAKLAFETELAAAGIDHCIVRPTAFFKSLSGQVKRVLAGKPFLVFGSGTETACKPIRAADLAALPADSVQSESARNQTLPIGGPGPAITPHDQGMMLFELSGRAPRFRSVSPNIFRVAQAVLSRVGRLLPAAAKKAELARIGHYYATESMLVWDEDANRYDEAATPSTGSRTLMEHYERLLSATSLDDELGDHRVF